MLSPRLALFALAFLAAAHPAAAQQIDGRVVSDSAGASAGEVVVQLLAKDGAVLRSRATDPSGFFSWRGLAPGSYQVRVLRIGYLAWVSPAVTVEAGQVARPVFVVPDTPLVLEELEARATNACGAQSEGNLALLWDQVRASLGRLGANQAAKREYHSVITKVKRGAEGKALSLRSYELTGSGEWPFISQPPESLAAQGYVQPGSLGLGPTYFAPDVPVFFSQTFLDTHCFRAVKGAAADTALIGLGFAPVPSRKTIDITGVLWLRREGYALERLEYNFAGLWRWVPPKAAGGQILFGRGKGGEPVITRWEVRAPIAVVNPDQARDADATTRPWFGVGKVSFGGWEEEVGQVKEVRSPAGTIWSE